MLGARPTAVFLGGLAACSAPSPGLQRLELPVSDAHDSAIVAVTRAAEAPRLWAVDLGAAAPLPIVEALAKEDAVHVDALLFEVPLASLGLEAGRLEAAGSSAPFTVPLPRPDASFAAEVRGGAPGPWAEVDALSEDLSRVRLARAPRCVVPTARDLDWSAPGELKLSVAWTRPGARRADRVVVGVWVRDANDDHVTDMYLLSPDGGQTVEWADPPQRFDAVHPGPDHSLLLTLSDGEVWKGVIDLEAGRFSARRQGFVAAHARAHWVAGPPVADDALYLLTIEDVMGDEEPALADGLLARFQLDNTPEGDLLYFEPDLKTYDNPGDMAWVGPEELVIVWPLDDGAVTRFRAGAVDVDEIADPRQVEHLPGWTTIVATGDGDLRAADDGEWRSIARLDAGVTHLAKAGERMWAATEEGRLHQLVPGVGLCPTSIDSPLTIEAMVGLEDGVVIIGTRPGDGRRTARWYQL